MRIVLKIQEMLKVIVSEDHEESSSETGGARRRVVRENSVFTEEQREDPVVSKQVQKSGKMPKPNSFIKIKLDNDSEWVKAKVLSFQPKPTGRNKDWLNIHVAEDEKPQSIDWSRAESWRNALHTEQVALLSEHDELCQEIIDAKEKEIENLVENKVFQVVPNENQVCISSRWVITEKLNCDGKKMTKARLVAKSYEEDSSI